MTDATDNFELFSVCKWQAQGKAAIAIPVMRITETGKKRITPRERPYRRGAKLDDTGPKALGWALECVFHNSHEEKDVDPENYTNTLQPFLDTFTINETGTLYLPTRGPVRARFDGYRRVEDAGMRDAASVSLDFIEDNEDDTTAASFAQPSARAIARALAQEATFSMENAGVDPFDISQINELASGLEALANGPSQFVEDLETKANALVHACQSVADTFSKRANEGVEEVATLLSRPDSSHVGRSLAKLADSAKRLTAEVGGVGRTTIRTFPRVISIFEVATIVKQDSTRLLQINPRLENPMSIPPKTPIRVFET